MTDFIGVERPLRSVMKRKHGARKKTKTQRRRLMNKASDLIGEITTGQVDYRPSYDELAQHVSVVYGSSNDELAKYFKVAPSTIQNWKRNYPSFAKATRVGKEEADNAVAHRLYRRAMGYSHPEEKIHFDREGEVIRADTMKHYPPDTGAAQFWLTNRQPTLWRQRVEHTGPDGTKLEAAQQTILLVNGATQEAAAKAYTDLVELEDGTYGQE